MGNEGSHSNLEVGQGDIKIDNDLRVTWRKVSQTGVPLQGRDGHCACACNGRLYMFGGVVETAGEGHKESNELLVFNPEMESWSVVEGSGDVPPPRSSASLAAVGDNLYLFGGLSQTGGWMSSVFMFDTGRNFWRELTVSGLGPSPRDKLATATVDSKIYIFGGFGPAVAVEGDNNEAEDIAEEEEEEDLEDNASLEETEEAAKFGWFDDLFVFDTVKLSWSQPMHLNKGGPTPRAAHTMCAVANNLIIFGGRDSVARRNDLYVYNTETRKWLTDLKVTGLRPMPRSFHAACTVGHRVIVIGGRGNSNEHFDDLHVLDTETWQWLQPAVEGEPPTPRSVHTATVVGSCLVLFGGSSDFDAEIMQCRSYLGDTYVLNIEELLRGKATAPKDAFLQSGDGVGDKAEASASCS